MFCTGKFAALTVKPPSSKKNSAFLWKPFHATTLPPAAWPAAHICTHLHISAHICSSAGYQLGRSRSSGVVWHRLRGGTHRAGSGKAENPTLTTLQTHHLLPRSSEQRSVSDCSPAIKLPPQRLPIKIFLPVVKRGICWVWP